MCMKDQPSMAEKAIYFALRVTVLVLPILFERRNKWK